MQISRKGRDLVIIVRDPGYWTLKELGRWLKRKCHLVCGLQPFSWLLAQAYGVPNTQDESLTSDMHFAIVHI
jgi:hypothetical protein